MHNSKVYSCDSLISKSKNILSVRFSLYIGKIVLGFINQEKPSYFCSFIPKGNPCPAISPLSNDTYISLFPL